MTFKDTSDFRESSFIVPDASERRWNVVWNYYLKPTLDSRLGSQVFSCVQAMIGDRYGFRPFPSSIAASEFEMLVAVAGESEDVAVLREWYQVDENAVPACYVLRVRCTSTDS